jgi:hypothetical protein
MDPYECIIRKLAANPVKRVYFGCKPCELTIHFENGTIRRRRNFNGPFRLFLISLCNVSYRRCDNKEDCIPTPLGHFEFLCWKSGDEAVFEKHNIKIPIRFS